MISFKQYLAEGSLNVHDFVRGELGKMGYTKTRVEPRGSHDAIVYNLKNGKGERSFFVSRGKKADGGIHHHIRRDLRKQVTDHENR
jgi:hypothetical protein